MQDLKTAAEKKVKETAYPSAETFLKRIRKNLFSLLCQSDFAEAGTDVDLFGGKEAVAQSIAKTVLNFYCLGEVLGVDIKSAIQEEIKKTMGDAGFNPPEHIKEVPPAIVKEEKAAVPPSQPVQEEKTNADTSLPPKERYKAEFAAAKTEDIVKNVWKQVSADKTLPGADKFALQNDCRTALERLKKS